MNVVIPGRSRFQAQVNRLKYCEIPKWFGVENKDFDAWLDQFGVTESRLEENGNSFIGLPLGLVPVGARQAYLKQLCSDLEWNGSLKELKNYLNRDEVPVRAYVICDVLFDTWSTTTEKAVTNWPRLRKELRTTERDGLTIEEVIASITYDPNRYNRILALGSEKDDLVPCLEPITGSWRLSLLRLSTLRPPSGSACPITAPTAKRR